MKEKSENKNGEIDFKDDELILFFWSSAVLNMCTE